MVSLSRISPIRMMSGGLAKSVFQRDREALGVGADFALVDDGFLVLEDEFDRILERKDMPGLALVAEIDHRRERRGLAGTCCADHEDQAALGHDHFLEDFRDPEAVQRRDAARNETHDDRW